MERSTLSARSRRLFTLSAIYTATNALIQNLEPRPLDDLVTYAVTFWDEISRHFPEWQQVRERKLTAGEVRRDFIHSHGIALQALGRVGNTLLQEKPNAWKGALKQLRTIDWSRSNAKLWEGRAMIGGKVSKAGHNVQLTTNVVKNALGLPLNPDEKRVEDAFKRGGSAQPTSKRRSA
jgi:DNA sulfur modification protein DndB